MPGLPVAAGQREQVVAASLTVVVRLAHDGPVRVQAVLFAVVLRRGGRGGRRPEVRASVGGHGESASRVITGRQEHRWTVAGVDHVAIPGGCRQWHILSSKNRKRVDENNGTLEHRLPDYKIQQV
jgi:hypothetical protein